MDYLIIKSFIPEIFLSIFILCQLVYNSYLSYSISLNFPTIEKEICIQISLAFTILFLLFLNLKVEAFLSTFLLVNNIGIYLIKLLLVFFSFISFFSIINCFQILKLNFFEYFCIYLLSILSSFFLISCYDMLTAYIVIEMQALSFYILSCFNRNSAFSSEAGLKYFISGSFISGIFLLGCSLIYGTLGTLNFNILNNLLIYPLDLNFYYLNILLFIGCLFVTVTFLFKLAAVPFHFWVPDVYEGAPLPTTIIFSLLPKLSLFTFFIRWLSIILDKFYPFQSILFFCGLLTIFIGSLLALKQKRLKRLIIYSSISQGGFLISALSVNTIESASSIYFFLTIYLISSVLVWLKFSNFYTTQINFNSFLNFNQTPLYLSSLSNFFKSNLLWSLSFIIIFFSFAGIPPLSGFLSKIFIILSLLKTQTISNSYLLILVSIIPIFYYLRIIKIVFFEQKENYFNKENFQVVTCTLFFDTDCFILALSLFLLIFLFINPVFLILCNNCIVLDSNFLFI